MATSRNSDEQPDTSKRVIRNDSPSGVLPSRDTDVHSSHFCYSSMGTGGVVFGMDSYGNHYRSIPGIPFCQIPPKDNKDKQA